MLYKLFTIALLLAITTNISFAADDEAEATLSPGSTDIRGDDNNEIDVDTDNADDNIEDGDNDDDDDLFSLFQTTDFDDLETTDDSIDDTDSMDLDTTNDSNSNDDDSDDDSDSDDDNSIDADSDEEDLCIGLTQNECGDVVADDGDAECAYNAVTGDCYDIERRDGRMGSGNFDDGYNTAKQQADDEQAQLELLVAVLGGVVGVLILVIIGGAIYFYKKGNSPKVNHHQMDQSMDVDGADR